MDLYKHVSIWVYLTEFQVPVMFTLKQQLLPSAMVRARTENRIWCW